MSVTQSARMSKITNDGLTRCDTGGRACVTADVDEVVGRHHGDAWLDAVLAWNVWLDLETDSSLAGVLKSKPCRYHVCKRTYNRIEDFFRLKSKPKTIVQALFVCLSVYVLPSVCLSFCPVLPINPLTPIVVIWVQLWSVLCQTGLNRRL